jgi:hypothetical protein
MLSAMQDFDKAALLLSELGVPIHAIHRFRQAVNAHKVHIVLAFAAALSPRMCVCPCGFGCWRQDKQHGCQYLVNGVAHDREHVVSLETLQALYEQNKVHFDSLVTDDRMAAHEMFCRVLAQGRPFKFAKALTKTLAASPPVALPSAAAAGPAADASAKSTWADKLRLSRSSAPPPHTAKQQRAAPASGIYQSHGPVAPAAPPEPVAATLSPEVSALIEVVKSLSSRQSQTDALLQSLIQKLSPAAQQSPSPTLAALPSPSTH